MVNNLSMRLSLRFTLEVIAEQRAIQVKSEALGELGHEDDGMRMTSWINCEFSCVDHVVILPSNIYTMTQLHQHKRRLTHPPQ